MTRVTSLAFLALFSLSTATFGVIAERPEDVQPLMAGTAAPTATVQKVDGSEVDLADLVNAKPTLLVFYRGGWCPYCNLQLSALRLLEPDLEGMGFQLIAISPDRPEELVHSVTEQELTYQLLSDSKADLMEAFGIAYKVDQKTLDLYKEYGIDLEVASGQSMPKLPVPSVFILDGAGVIQFVYSNPDYRTRVPESLLRAALEATAEGELGRPLK